jgi:hypothetical protein
MTCVNSLQVGCSLFAEVAKNNDACELSGMVELQDE